MGGTVAVCVRHPGGRVVCGHAWTGSLSAFHHEPAFVDDVEVWLNGPPIDPELGRGSLAPAGYGLVLYDRVTHTIVSMSAHAIPGEKSAAFAHLLYEMVGYEDEQPAWEALNARGLLSLQPWFERERPKRALDATRTLRSQLGEIPDGERVEVDMSPWKVVVVESGDRTGLEAALAAIDVTIPADALPDWDEHFDEE